MLPNNSNQRFRNQNDLVHYILNNSCLVLNFRTDRLPKAELQDLHRYLKFQHVSLKCDETVGKALRNMMNTDNIVALLEKIGFKKLPNGHFKHACIEEEFQIAQVINAIRAQREDLMHIIGEKGKRVRDKKTLSLEDDYTLRIWAAESDIPLQFFDEDTNCKEAMEDNQLMDEDEEEMQKVSDQINSEHSNVGDRVFAVEEADDSNTGSINQVPMPSQTPSPKRQRLETMESLSDEPQQPYPPDPRHAPAASAKVVSSDTQGEAPPPPQPSNLSTAASPDTQRGNPEYQEQLLNRKREKLANMLKQRLSEYSEEHRIIIKLRALIEKIDEELIELIMAEE